MLWAKACGQSVWEGNGVTRLFIALDLPPQIAAELARLQPPPLAGIRLISAAQMHLTLHFIGEAAIAPVLAACRAIVAPAFSLRLSAVGQFRAADGAVTLWLGAEINDALMALHGAIAIGLKAYGCQPGWSPDPRPYRPHITLARCKPQVPARVIADFMGQRTRRGLPAVPVHGFALYSSITGSEGAQYTLEQWFPLHGVPAPAESGLHTPLQ